MQKIRIRVSTIYIYIAAVDCYIAIERPNINASSPPTFLFAPRKSPFHFRYPGMNWSVIAERLKVGENREKATRMSLEFTAGRSRGPVLLSDTRGRCCDRVKAKLKTA